MTSNFTPTIPPAVSASAKPAAEPSSDKGPGTRRRLLDAAAEMFAAHGVRNVAIRDICDRACANIAAVNYHFGGKDKLHLAAIDHARQRALKESSAAPKPAGRQTPQQKLRRHLRSILGRAFADGPAGWYMKLILREMVDPTPALRETIDNAISPQQRRLEAIVGQAMGEDPDSERVKDAAASLLATAIYYQSCRPAVQHLRPGFEYDQATAERLADLLTAMVVGGATAG